MSKLRDFESKLYQCNFTLISDKTYYVAWKLFLDNIWSYEQITTFVKRGHGTGWLNVNDIWAVYALGFELIVVLK